MTGASSGIGLAIARALADKGGRVLAVATNVEKLKAAFEDTCIATLVENLSRAEGFERVFQEADRLWGGVDILFANAGFAYFERSDRADWDHEAAIFSVNTLGPIYAFQRLRATKGKEPFLFAVTSSAMAFVGIPGYGSYAATKAAVLQYFDTVRYELEPGQRVMTIHPVATRTAFFKRADASYVPWPTQDPSTVSKAVVSGIERDRERVFPFFLFPVVYAIFSIIPPAKTAYLKNEWKKTGLGNSQTKGGES